MPCVSIVVTEVRMTMIRTYSELSKLRTLEERFRYLKLKGQVGASTFGFDRYLNQNFYKSKEWKDIRNQIIVRDLGCELGLEDYEINGRIIIHHMNPIKDDDIVHASDFLTNPEYLVCVSHDMHNAIHFSDENILKKYEVVERTPFDTCPWKRR